MVVIIKGIGRLPYAITFATVTSFVLLLLTSQALAQDTNEPTFSQAVQEKTVFFEATNPFTKVPGVVTITLEGGVFHVKRVTEGQEAGRSRVTGNQHGSFKFVPYDSSQPTFTGTFKFQIVGQMRSDLIIFDFPVKSAGSDGSSESFIQREVATINEYGTEISFGKLKRLVIPKNSKNSLRPEDNAAIP